MGYIPQQTTIEIIKETSKWWVPIIVAIITTLGIIIGAFIKRGGKE